MLKNLIAQKVLRTSERGSYLFPWSTLLKIVKICCV